MKESDSPSPSLLVFLPPFVTALIKTGLWYCLDDSLAAHFSSPTIGDVPFWIVYILTLLL